MNALVFAAGLGTRLKPWTDSHPKALVPVGGVEMLERVLRKLEKTGMFSRVVVNVHHFAEQVTEFLANREYGFQILISDERKKLLDTGGGTAVVIDLLKDLGEPLLIHNADILTDFPPEDMILDFTDSEADATLLCDERDTSRKILFDEDSKMVGWINLSTEEKKGVLNSFATKALAFGGVHILGSRAQNLLLQYFFNQPSPAFGIMQFYIDNCHLLNIRAFTPQKPYRWHDIGSPEKLCAAEESIKN